MPLTTDRQEDREIHRAATPTGGRWNVMKWFGYRQKVHVHWVLQWLDFSPRSTAPYHGSDTTLSLESTRRIWHRDMVVNI